MRIAHIAIATPHRCGLYETTRELVTAERALGVDAGIVDPQPVVQFYPGIGEDRGAPICDAAFAESADILVDHSGVDCEVGRLNKPIIHVAHGRPESSFIGERNRKSPVLSYQYNKASDERFQAVVTFWPTHAAHLRLLWGKPVYAIQPCVDLQAFSPQGSLKSYFDKEGSPNVVIADPWRDDITPYSMLTAFSVFAETFKNAKLHIYGLQDKRGVQPALNRLKQRGRLGEVHGWYNDLASVYRSADVLITPHRIATRSIREASACGCQVVSGNHANPHDPEKFAEAIAFRLNHPFNMRAVAEQSYKPQRTAEQFVSLAESFAEVPVGD